MNCKKINPATGGAGFILSVKNNYKYAIINFDALNLI
jgi:hypothetical protein